MTKIDEYLDVLQHQPKPRPEQKLVLEMLQSFCDAIQKFKQGHLLCSLDPGFSTNWGQEWRPTLKSLTKNFEHVLLRAYVPAAGFPVMLDLYEKQIRSCATPDELDTDLKRFLKQENVVATIETLSR